MKNPLKIVIIAIMIFGLGLVGSVSHAQSVNSNFYIYVTDLNNNRVQKFDSSGKYISQFGVKGAGNGEFNAPVDIVTDSNGDIYVVELNNDRVQKFDSSGKYITQFGSNGSGDGQFDFIGSSAIDPYGNIYVADLANSRVQKFDSSGKYISQFGSDGSGDGEFFFASSVDLDSSGNLYVTDLNNYRVEKFDPSGKYISQFNVYGYTEAPIAIAVDKKSNNIYVVGLNSDSVQKFDSSGKYIGQFGTKGTRNGEFNTVGGIRVDSQGNIYVADTGNSRIQKFDSSGRYISQFGSFGSGDGQFKNTSSIAFSPVVLDPIPTPTNIVNASITLTPPKAGEVFLTFNSNKITWKSVGLPENAVVYPTLSNPSGEWSSDFVRAEKGEMNYTPPNVYSGVYSLTLQVWVPDDANNLNGSYHKTALKSNSVPINVVLSQAGANSISLTTTPNTIVSGQQVKLGYVIPSSANSIVLTLSCPIGVSITNGGGNICGIPIKWNSPLPTASLMNAINTTSVVQKVSAGLLVSYPDGSMAPTSADFYVQPSQPKTVPTPTPTQTPTTINTSIYSINPPSAKVGDTITIIGQGFEGVDASRVYLRNGGGEISPIFITSTPNKVVFNVPGIPAATYTVTVVGSNGTDSKNLVVNSASTAPVPVVTPVTTPTPTTTVIPTNSPTPTASPVSPTITPTSPSPTPTGTPSTSMNPRIDSIQPSNILKVGDTVTLNGVGFSGVDPSRLFLVTNNGLRVPVIFITSNENKVVFNIPNIISGSYSVIILGNSGNSNTVPITVTSLNGAVSISFFDWLASFFR